MKGGVCPKLCPLHGVKLEDCAWLCLGETLGNLFPVIAPKLVLLRIAVAHAYFHGSRRREASLIAFHPGVKEFTAGLQVRKKLLIKFPSLFNVELGFVLDFSTS